MLSVDELVVFFISGRRGCVTGSDEFEGCILNSAVHRVFMIGLKNIRGDSLNLQKGISNKKYRWMAYTSFIWWMYGEKLGHKNRKVIPACVTHMIRECFPLDDGETSFKPFEYASDDE